MAFAANIGRSLRWVLVLYKNGHLTRRKPGSECPTCILLVYPKETK